MKIILFCIFCLLILNNFVAAEGIMAIVNNEAVTAKDINEYLNLISFQLAAQYKGEELQKRIDELKPDILERLIEDKLILQEAKRQSIQVDEFKVEERLSQFKKSFNSPEEFQSALLGQGFTIADLMNKFREQLLMYEIVNKEVKSKIVILPNEVTQFYQNHIQDFQEPEGRQVVSIFIDAKEDLEEVMAALNRNEDFIELSKRFSKGSNSLGIVKRGQLRKEVENIIFSLKLSEVSRPLKVDAGFYIFKLEEIIPERMQDLSEVKEKIYDYLFEEKFKAKMVKWLDGLKNKAYISIK